MFDNVRRVFGHSVVYGSADVAIQAVNFLLLPIYTRVLSPVEYGALALLLVLEAFLKPVYRLGLGTSFVRFYYDYTDERSRQTLAGTIVILLLGAGVVLLAILLAAAGDLTALVIGSSDYVRAFALLALNLALTSFFLVPFGILRVQERSTTLASITFARSSGTLIVRLVLVVGLGLGVLGIMLADVIVSLVLLLALASRIRAAVAARFSRAMAREVLRFGLPQLPQALLHQAMAMSDRFILALYLPLEQVGVYLIGTSIASLIKLYPVAFRTAWMPFAFDRMTRPDAPRLFAKLATYAFAVLTFSTLGMVALAESLVTLMTPAEFHAAVTVVPLLALGMAIQTTMNFVGTSVEVSKRTHLYPLATAVGAVIAVGGQFILIPRFGIVGAAVAVGLGQLVLALTLGALAQRAYSIPYEWLRLGKLVAVAVALYALMVTVAPGAGIGVLLVRLGLMAVFPIGLLGLRFFRPAELADLRHALARVQIG